MNVSIKFEIDSLSSLSENARKLLDKSEARKWLDFIRAWPKVNLRSEEFYNEYIGQV